MKRGELLVFDEADEYIFSDPKQFLNFTKHVQCICLTATSHDQQNEGFEDAVLKHIGFRIFRKSLGADQLSQKLPEFEFRDISGDNDLAAFIGQRLK